MPRGSMHPRLAAEWAALTSALRAVELPSAQSFAGWAIRAPRVVELFAEIEDVRMEWAELRARKWEGVKSRLITSQWTLKHLVAHMASWAREFRLEAEAVARGESLDYQIPFTPGVGPTAWNHAEVARRAMQTLDEAFEELDAESQRIQNLLLTLPEETLAASAEFPPRVMTEPPRAMWRSIAEGALMKCGHERLHLGRIREWLAEQRK